MIPKSDEEILKELSNLSPEELLIKSTEYNYIKGVEKALELGVDVNEIPHGYFDPALSIAVYNNTKNLKLIELLLKNGANPNEKDDTGYTPLMNASINGDKDIVELLLKYGANVNILYDDKHTALYFASENGDNDIVELLKKNK